MAAKLHELKIRKEFFVPALNGMKPWELRLDDRKFKPGDYIFLIEISREIDKSKPYEYMPTGREILGRITYIACVNEFLDSEDSYVIFTYKNIGKNIREDYIAHHTHLFSFYGWMANQPIGDAYLKLVEMIHKDIERKHPNAY